MKQGEREESHQSSDSASNAASPATPAVKRSPRHSSHWIEQFNTDPSKWEDNIDSFRRSVRPSTHPELSDIGRKIVRAWEAAASSSGWKTSPRDLGKKYALGDFNTIQAQLAPQMVSIPVLMLLAVWVYLTRQFSLASEQHAMAVALFVCAVCAVVATAGWVMRSQVYATRIHEQLRNSSLLERLLLQDKELTAITSRVPWPFRLLYARYEQLDLELTAKLVAYNLDWYLWPRELIIRGEWVVGLSYMLVVTGYLFFPYSSAGVPPGTTSLSYIHPILLVASFVTVYSFIMHLSRQRLIIHCDALIAHFLARHAATPDEQNGE